MDRRLPTAQPWFEMGATTIDRPGTPRTKKGAGSEEPIQAWEMYEACRIRR